MAKENHFRELASRLRGPLLLPGGEGYDDARRIFNAMIDKRPAAIARCASTQDVVESVRFARQHDLQVSVRGGGHNVAGKAVCDDGLMIDLSRMKGIRVDPARLTAQAQAGLTGGEFDRETQAFGLATTLGIVSTTGIAGLTLGGGLGWLMGKYGLACDNVLSFDVVTADGRVLTASAEENSDLYWGLRGGGGNFGIVTSFEYSLHPVGPVVLGGMVMHPLAKAREALRFYREFTASCPDELSTQAGVSRGPDGDPILSIQGCYCGLLSEGEKALKPLRSFGPPVADQFGPLPYAKMQQLVDPFMPPGKQNYWKSNFLRALSDDAIEAFLDIAGKMPPLDSAVTPPLPKTIPWFEHMHGAAARVSVEETAFSHRQYPFNFAIFSIWSDPAENEEMIHWTRTCWKSMEPFMAAGSYINYLEEEADPRARATFGANYERLASLKRKYDPDNFFRMNQNIVPARASG